MGSVRKAHLLHAEPGRVVLRTHMQLFGSRPHCFMGNRLEGMTGRQTTVYLDLDTGGRFWKWPKWGCHFKENNWWYLLPMTKFSKQTWEKTRMFENLHILSPMTWTVFEKFKTFLMRLEVILMKVSFWSCLMKCVNCQKADITLQTNIIQWPVYHVPRSPQNTNQSMHFRVAEYEKFTEVISDFVLQLIFKKLPIEFWCM